MIQLRTYNLCLIGFGNVGQALVRLLEVQRLPLRERYGIEWRLTGLLTRRLGAVANLAGIDPWSLVPHAAPADSLAAADLAGWLGAARADVLLEASSLDTAHGEPAATYLRTALGLGIHAITANKGPLVYAYRELRDLADAHGVRFRFESTVMDGAPIFSLFRVLPLLTVGGFRGILNSTTNLILERVEAGASLEEGIAAAQALGLAETDPSADVDGWDATVKVSAIAQVILGASLLPGEVRRVGIRGLDGPAVRAARAAGRPYKLVCRAWRHGDGVTASVGPEQLAPGDPLAAVNGTSSAVHFEADLLPGLTVVEHSPTPATTAYGMLADFVDVTRAGAGPTGQPREG